MPNALTAARIDDRRMASAYRAYARWVARRAIPCTYHNAVEGFEYWHIFK